MADGPSLTRAIAAAIGDVVAADPACRRLIPEVSLYNAAQQAAGGLRNAVNMLFEARAKQFYEELNARPQSEVSAGQIAAARHQWQWVQAEGYAEDAPESWTLLSARLTPPSGRAPCRKA